MGRRNSRNRVKCRPRNLHTVMAGCVSKRSLTNLRAALEDPTTDVNKLDCRVGRSPLSRALGRAMHCFDEHFTIYANVINVLVACPRVHLDMVYIVEMETESHMAFAIIVALGSQVWNVWTRFEQIRRRYFENLLKTIVQRSDFDVNAVHWEYGTLFAAAIRFGNAAIAEYLMTVPGIDLTKQDSRLTEMADTLLTGAIKMGHPTLVARLLAAPGRSIVNECVAEDVNDDEPSAGCYNAVMALRERFAIQKRWPCRARLRKWKPVEERQIVHLILQQPDMRVNIGKPLVLTVGDDEWLIKEFMRHDSVDFHQFLFSK